ncbi:MAG: hypothetical protein P4L26_16285 [Terracidiphilus sp.]|nr:hypothetical protein [Terracidiphilus sp.]
MARAGFRKCGWLLGGLVCACTVVAFSQQEAISKPLTESGQVVVAGRSTPFLIRRLPVSSFPDLPESVVVVLNRRGCLIPQTYEAHHPENVVHASLERAGSSDWAVLCSVEGKVSLLVFFDGGSAETAGKAAGQPMVLASTMEVDRLEAHPGSGVLGFNWGIDPASPEQVHVAQTGLENRPARVDHDALVDSVIEHRSVYHFYARSAWTVLEMPE